MKEILKKLEKIEIDQQAVNEKITNMNSNQISRLPIET